MLITEAQARCAGAGRTNCSVGVSEEFIQRMEAKQKSFDHMMVVTLGLFLLGCAGLAAVMVYATTPPRRSR